MGRSLALTHLIDWPFVAVSYFLALYGIRRLIFHLVNRRTLSFEFDEQGWRYGLKGRAPVEVDWAKASGWKETQQAFLLAYSVLQLRQEKLARLWSWLSLPLTRHFQDYGYWCVSIVPKREMGPKNIDKLRR